MEGTGLVLSGGGGKGAYQAGMLKALAEAGMLDDVVAISGTSIGSINAVLYAEGYAEGGIEKAVEQLTTAWEKIDYNIFLDIEYGEVIAGARHFSRAATVKLIDEYVTPELLTDSVDRHIPIIVTAAKCPEYVEITEKITEDEMTLLMSTSTDTTYSGYTVSYMPLTNKDEQYIKSALLASTALPVIYNPVEVEGALYIDGGVKDNVPIKPLYDMGIRRFIVIELKQQSGIKFRDYYSDAEIIDILPSQNLGELLSGTMNFDKEDLAFKRHLGELDGKRYIKTLFEKDEDYIAVEAEKAALDYQRAKDMASFDRKYGELSGSVNRNMDYISKLEESLKKYEE